MKNDKISKSIRHDQIKRAVASSTAIETGTPIKALEALLKAQSSKFQHLKLAN